MITSPLVTHIYDKNNDTMSCVDSSRFSAKIGPNLFLETSPSYRVLVHKLYRPSFLPTQELTGIRNSNLREEKIGRFRETISGYGRTVEITGVHGLSLEWDGFRPKNLRTEPKTGHDKGYEL